jgi:hypothetical protein
MFNISYLRQTTVSVLLFWGLLAQNVRKTKIWYIEKPGNLKIQNPDPQSGQNDFKSKIYSEWTITTTVSVLLSKSYFAKYGRRSKFWYFEKVVHGKLIEYSINLVPGTSANKVLLIWKKIIPIDKNMWSSCTYVSEAGLLFAHDCK